jgi:hypothetical protein
MACLRQLYTHPNSAFTKHEDYKKSNREYVTVYKDNSERNKALDIINNIETFPQMLQFAKKWNDECLVNIYRKCNYASSLTATDFIKETVRTYAKILSHNHDASKEEASQTDETV